MSEGMFTRASKREAKLRLALEGPAGSGKTYTALKVGGALINGAGIALVDTERHSASKYADLFSFDVLELDPPFHPDRFIEAINGAAQAGYGLLILDSLSHAWNGEGGVLSLVDQIAQSKYRGDTHRAWKDGGELQLKLTDAILGAPLHVIATMRTKTEYSRTEEGGKTQIRKVGTKAIQRDEFDYEFDLIGTLSVDNVMHISKSRCPALADKTIKHPGEELADALRTWLSAGEPLADEKSTASFDKALADLTAKEPDRNWREVAGKFAVREFKRGLALLTDEELAKVTDTLRDHLKTLNEKEKAEAVPA